MSEPRVRIRKARPSDLALLGQVEDASGQLFAELEMDPVAQMEPSPVEVLRSAMIDQRLFVAVWEDDPIGFLQLEYVDECPHVQQVSVHPSYSRRGIGAHLLRVAEQWSRKRSHSQITLTTYRDVPWNAPYYARLGWVELPPEHWGSQLTFVRKQERLLGLDGWPRIAMSKQL